MGGYNFGQMFGGLQQMMGGFDPSLVTPEFIESLGLMVAVMQAGFGMQQIEMQGAQLGLDQQTIDLEKAKLRFQMEQMLPFEHMKLEFNKQMQQLELQTAQEGTAAARERTLQAQQGTLQSQEATKQAQFGTKNAELGYQLGLVQLEEARRANNAALRAGRPLERRIYLGLP